MKMTTPDGRFELTVMELNGKKTLRLMQYGYWLGNFSRPEPMYSVMRSYGGDPADLEEVTENDEIQKPGRRHLQSV